VLIGIRCGPIRWGSFPGAALGALYLGAVVLGPVVGTAGYFLTHWIWKEQPVRLRKLPGARLGAGGDNPGGGCGRQSGVAVFGPGIGGVGVAADLPEAEFILGEERDAFDEILRPSKRRAWEQ